MKTDRIAALAEAWVSSSKAKDGELILFDECHEEPEIAWQTIIAISERPLSPEQDALLAAGPLEDLLSFHGASFIERVELEAGRNPKFNHLLGGVWKCCMTDDIWNRVQKARREVW
jgi:hypothetical protein